MNMDIRTIEIEGIEKTAISIGPDDITIPKHLMQGEKQAGIIIDSNGTKSSWYWDGISSSGGIRYVYFGKCELQDFTALSSARRSDALKIVLQIARGLMDADKSFLSLSSGIFPLNRIYIYNRDSILLLPPDLADVFSMMETDEDKHRHVTAVIRGNAEQNFMLITEMAELLYYAASGVFPFASDTVRGSGYKEAPISLYAKLPEKTEGLINFIFHAKNREMRDIMGNRDGGENLSWFLKRTEDLEWNLDNISEEERDRNIEKTENSPEYAAFFKERSRIEKRNSFWRVKGTIIIVVTIIVLSVGGFLFNYISNLLEPPETKDLEPVGIIEAFYASQSECMPESLTTAFKGCSAPQEMEVTNLYVSTRTRMAYENFDPLINAAEWVEDGMPPVPESSAIYGVVLENITQTGENTYTAESTWYTPYPYDESETVQATLTSIPVYVYDIDQSFTFTWNDRGWWNITDTEITDSKFLRTEIVSTYALER